VDFLLVIIERFSLVVTAEAYDHEYWSEVAVMKVLGQFGPKFQV